MTDALRGRPAADRTRVLVPQASAAVRALAHSSAAANVSSCSALCVLGLCAHSNSSGRAFLDCCCLCCCKAVAWTQIWMHRVHTGSFVCRKKNPQAGLARTVHTRHGAAVHMAVCVDCAASCAKCCSDRAYCECRDIAAVGVPRLACQFCCTAFIGTKPSWAASASPQLVTAASTVWLVGPSSCH